MTEIYSNNFVKIVEDQYNKTIFRIEFDYTNRPLINSIIKTKILKGATSTNNYKTLQFKATTVKTFKQFQDDCNKIRGTPKLSINDILLLIYSLAKQLNYLIVSENRTIVGYNPEHIIVINDSTFIFVGSELITELDENMALISCPFIANDFFVSPELLQVKELPAHVHYKTTYFSFACLILYALLADDIFYIEYLKQDAKTRCIKVSEYVTSHHINNTKLGWLLLRCLVEEPENRSILFI